MGRRCQDLSVRIPSSCVVVGTGTDVHDQMTIFPSASILISQVCDLYFVAYLLYNDISIHACMDACMYVCIFCMHACMYVCMYV